MKAQPKLKRRKGKGGVFVGDYFTLINGLKVDLGTEDARVALKNLREAKKGKRDFMSDSFAAAAATVAALADPEPAPVLPLPLPVPPIAEGKQSSDQVPELEPLKGTIVPNSPILRALPPLPDQAPHAAAAANAAAGGDPDRDEAPPQPAPPVLRFGDATWLKGAFVTVSKLLVSLQLKGHAIAARYVMNVDLGELEPPRKPPETLEAFGELLKELGEPWKDYDPREPGRVMWESFLRRVCPDELPIPDWLQAPIMVALFALPVQIMGARPAAPQPDQQPEATTGDEQPAVAA